ncbi:M48 family metallopeptidase [Paracoccus sp. 1_MG-2023]|uniref:M48 family metallopeptidase n=1 Tax=unclassified Paracoccus (in: a-proteobacteria) TaxID=2688777 RepID=UPI001C09AC52|nr:MULTISPECIES: M48 family metallopeptidase [unclassified Paracoccus (in: a-proteobacteria)]MBU2958427.1 M48 family metallopeptidase [Paracoccus sp. C2R09]MDO6668588.1 M48 family metallopeptidase [Paracoccus sp. 1_MG-2023]
MLKLTPILLLILYVAAMWFFSAWRLRQELNQKATPLRHPRLTPMLERLGAAMDLPPISAHVYEVAPVNGLAAPDGRIFLTRGFLDKLDADEVTPEELASVVAHELGHVSLGHSRRRLIDFAGQNAIRMALAGVLGRILPGVGAWIANIVATAVAARLSRQDEFEADRFASALMIKAGLGVEPQVSLFHKLDALTGRRGSPPAWFLSHPPAAKRIEAIRTHEARWTST